MVSKFTNISCSRETRAAILREAKLGDTYDVFIQKLLILKKRHEKEFENIEI